MLLRKNCIADRDCEACRFQDNCMVWNAFYTPMRLKPGYVTGKESLGYLIECDNLDTLMDEGHGFVFRLKFFGRQYPAVRPVSGCVLASRTMRTRERTGEV